VCGFFWFLPVILSAQVWAQAAAESEVPKFSSRTQLVLVPVVVRGKDGAHVGGLGRDAFRIEEQGKVRTATIFEEVNPVPAGTAQAKSATPPALAGRSNFDYEDAPSGHLTILVLDLLNTPYLGQGDGMRRLVDYLAKTLPSNEGAAVFGLGTHGLKQLYAPTTDTAALLAALKGIPVPANRSAGTDASRSESKDGAPSGVSATQRQDITKRAAQDFSEFVSTQGTDRWTEFDYTQASWKTLVAMTQIADAYGAVPGRKTLIWASAGFQNLLPSVGLSRQTLTDKYESTWRALNAASVAVYPVDVSDLAGFKGTLIGYRITGRKQQTLREFAASTGGIECVGIGIDFAKCLARDFDDAGSYYMLGYYLPSDDQKPGWRKLKVKVEANGAHVRAREGFYVTGAAEEKPEARKRQMVDAVLSPVELIGVRFNVREVAVSAETKAAAGKTVHEFEVGVLGNSVTVDAKNGNAVDLSVVSVAFNAEEKNAGQTERQIAVKLQPELLEKFRKTGVSVQQQLELAAGKYEIKFAVRDNLNGEIGTVGYPLEVK